MGEAYIFQIFMLILNYLYNYRHKLKRMEYLKSLEKLESKNDGVFIY